MTLVNPMEKLEQLFNDLNSLKIVSSKIIGTIIPIMNNMKTDNSMMIDMVIERVGDNVERKKILSTLQFISLSLVDDARRISKEIESFIESVTTNSGVESKISDCPFLTQVWFGDFYNNIDGGDAIKELNTDLIKTLNIINHDYIINKCISDLS